MCTRVTAAPAAALPLRRQVDSTRVNAELYIARDTIGSGEQTGFLVLVPEQGGLGELCQVPFHLNCSQPHAPVNAVSL
jgi:hypothetical protein